MAWGQGPHAMVDFGLRKKSFSPGVRLEQSQYRLSSLGCQTQ
jgi:hypothetical protein